MRLRRETGDFSIRFDGDTHTCEIRKGLNAEDLIGVVIQKGTRVGVVTGAGPDEAPYIRLSCPDVLSGPNDFINYNSETGVVRYNQRT